MGIWARLTVSFFVVYIFDKDDYINNTSAGEQSTDCRVLFYQHSSQTRDFMISEVITFHMLAFFAFL